MTSVSASPNKTPTRVVKHSDVTMNKDEENLTTLPNEISATTTSARTSTSTSTSSRNTRSHDLAHEHSAIHPPPLRTSCSSTYVTVHPNDDDDPYEEEDPAGVRFWTPPGVQRVRTTSWPLCGRWRTAAGCVPWVFLVVIVGFLLLANGILLAVRTNNNSNSNSNIPWKPLPPFTTTITKLAFGSCAMAQLPQPYWDTLQQYFDPQLTVLLGDNVYGDCTTDACTELTHAYDLWNAMPSFQGAKQSLAILPVLDDHDYGMNDCDTHNPHKYFALDAFLDFYDIHDDRRVRRDGVYQSYRWGQQAEQNNNNDDDTVLQVILLDTRLDRSEFLNSDEPNAPRKERYMEDQFNTSKRMLSDTQWTWLEQELKKPANVRLIASSIQVLADGTGYECWRMLPHERNRLVRLLEATLDESVTFLLSGDRHVAAFYKKSKLVEVTASSWTHTAPLGAFDDCSSAEDCDEVDERRLSEFVRVNNFGSVEIDWDERVVTLGIRRAESSPYTAYRGYVTDENRTDAGEFLRKHTTESMASLTRNIPWEESRATDTWPYREEECGSTISDVGALLSFCWRFGI